MDFTLKGGFDQPEVSVKPGSLLTPNALKNIFKAGEEDVDQDSQ